VSTLPLKFVSPSYVAVKVLDPPDNVIVQLPAATVPTQVLPLESFTEMVTLPVGVPLPGLFADTEKLTVTDCPAIDGLGK